MENSEMTNEEFEGKIVSALSQLNHENDDHWTGGGLPDVATVVRLAGIDSLKRADIDKVSPDFKRQTRPAEVKGKKKVEIKTEEIPLRATATRPKAKIPEGATVTVNQKVDNVLMRAISRGYYGGSVRDEGDVFTFTGRPGSWMEPA
jgi:hypothetical protein